MWAWSLVTAGWSWGVIYERWPEMRGAAAAGFWLSMVLGWCLRTGYARRVLKGRRHGAGGLVWAPVEVRWAVVEAVEQSMGPQEWAAYKWGERGGPE